jgi:hypothetical protein
MGLINKKKENDVITPKDKIHVTGVVKMYSRDDQNDFQLLHPYKIDITRIINKWQLKYTIDDDIKCPFCSESCEIILEKQSRCVDSPMIPKLQLCMTCPGYLEFMSQLDSKQIRLKHEFQYNGKTYHALYKNKVFLWKRVGFMNYELINMIYQSTDFREFILDETELGILNDKFETEYSFDKCVMGYAIDSSPSCEYRYKEPLYKVNLFRDIDTKISQAKEKAIKESENVQFYFPPKQQVYGATKISDDGMIEGDIGIIDKKRRIHGELLPSNHCTRIDARNVNSAYKLEYMNFGRIDTSLALHLMSFCDIYTVSQLGKINRWWKKTSYMDYLWKSLLKRDFSKNYKPLKYGGYRILYKDAYIEAQKKNLPQHEAYNPSDPCYGLAK